MTEEEALTIKVPPEKEPTTWLISDPHFDHRNIIKYCSRPFNSLEEMNNLILTNWKANIREDDLVFFLGDMAYGRDSRSPRWWLTQLPGVKVYLKGSHDHGIRPTSVLPGVHIVVPYIILETDTRDFLLIHVPENTPEWYEGWVVHGHHHNYNPYMDKTKRWVNISVERTNYGPINVTKLLEDTN